MMKAAIKRIRQTFELDPAIRDSEQLANNIVVKRVNYLMAKIIEQFPINLQWEEGSYCPNSLVFSRVHATL